MKSKITEAKSSVDISGQDGVTETALTLLPETTIKGAKYIKQWFSWPALDIRQWRAAISERQETSEVSPRLPQFTAWKGLQVAGQERWGKGAGAQRTPWLKETELRETKRARVQRTEYWGESYRGSELWSSVEGPPQAFSWVPMGTCVWRDTPRQQGRAIQGN